MKDIFSKLTVGGLIAVVSASLGFGLSQASLAREVTRNTSDIHALAEAIKAESGMREAADQMIGKSLDRITASMDVQTKQNTELISLIKVQNQILNQKP